MRRRGRLAALIAMGVMVILVIALAGCGGSSDSSTTASGSSTTAPSSSTSASSTSCTRENTAAEPVIVLPICPRPPRSAIPAAQARLRKTLAEVKDPDLPAAVIRRLELLVDVMYQAGRCGEHEIEECDYERWEQLAAKIWRQVISHGYEEEVRGLRRVMIEEGFHNQAARHGPRSIAARTWGRRLLRLEEGSAGDCRGIPTCDYEKLEAAAAKLRREMGLPASSAPSAPPRPAACASNELGVHPERHSALGTGTLYKKFLVVSYSGPCTLAGFPAVVALGRGGQVVEAGRPVREVRPGHPWRRRVVTLGRGHPAYFLVARHDGSGSSQCRSASTRTLRVRLPGDRRRTLVAYRMGYCPSPKGGLGLRVGRLE